METNELSVLLNCSSSSERSLVRSIPNGWRTSWHFLIDLSNTSSCMRSRPIPVHCAPIPVKINHTGRGVLSHAYNGTAKCGRRGSKWKYTKNTNLIMSSLFPQIKKMRGKGQKKICKFDEDFTNFSRDKRQKRRFFRDKRKRSSYFNVCSVKM